MPGLPFGAAKPGPPSLGPPGGRAVLSGPSFPRLGSFLSPGQASAPGDEGARSSQRTSQPWTRRRRLDQCPQGCRDAYSQNPAWGQQGSGGDGRGLTGPSASTPNKHRGSVGPCPLTDPPGHGRGEETSPPQTRDATTPVFKV